MINRLIKNLPPGEQERDILYFLESQPNYGELTFHAEADLGMVSLTIPRPYSYQYKDYLIEVLPINNHLYITCYKVTLEILIEKYGKVREKLSLLNNYLDDFDKELRLKEYHVRHETKLCMRTLKREIKSELTRQGINIKPGSALSKLLRL